MKSIKEAGDLKDKKIILRADWNAPINEGVITDTTKIDDSLETINYILENQGKIILLSHFGREGASLRPAYEYFASKFASKTPATFTEDLESIPDGNIVVLENIRKWPEEEDNNEEFAEKLASLGDLYVNEAFASSHEKHSSIIGIPKFIPHFAGIHFMQEYENLSKALNPTHPFLFILGGAKFDTKLPVLEKFGNIADNIFILGANAKPASETDIVKDRKILLPVGDVAALDANEETLDLVKEKAEQAKFILWNGPLGKYEDGYTEGTKKLASILAEVCTSGAEVIVGGGDTLSAIKELNIKDKFTFVSSAGGAMLDFLASGTLPGIEALK